MIVDNNACNDKCFTALALSFFSNLKVFEVGDYSFAFVDEVKLIGLNQLERVVIGKNCFTKEKNSWGNKDRDAIYLKYTVDFSNGLKLETEDTLVAHSRGVAREDFTPIYVKN